MDESIKKYVLNYYAALDLKASGITHNSALREVVSACTDKAFAVCVKGVAGKDYGIYDYASEIANAKQIAVRGIEQFLTADEPLDPWFSQLMDKIIGCFSEYNRKMESAENGRKFGFTYGNAQCLILVSVRNIMAHFTACGIHSYDKKFEKFRLPIDDDFYEYAQNALRKYPNGEIGNNEILEQIFSDKHWSELEDVNLCISFLCMAEMLLNSIVRFEEGAFPANPFCALARSCKFSVSRADA